MESRMLWLFSVAVIVLGFNEVRAEDNVNSQRTDYDPPITMNNNNSDDDVGALLLAAGRVHPCRW